jgi:nicotinamide mononucleotide transporter
LIALFDIDNIAFTWLGYPLSYIELVGTIFSMISVYLASKANVLTWPVGLIGICAFFVIFFQIQLYSDMLLQFYFCAFTVFGWYNWKVKPNFEKPRSLTQKWQIIYAIVLVAGAYLLGFFMQSVHLIFPKLFPLAAAYPFMDAFTTVASILATILLARKVIQTWPLWIAVDLLSVGLYTVKGVHLMAIEYAIFLLMCIYGWYNWKKTA